VHVGGTLVVPRLDEAVGVAVDVAEVDEVDLLAEVPYRLGMSAPIAAKLPWQNVTPLYSLS